VRVKVSSKVPGADRDTLPEVLVDLEADVTTAGELIRRAVEEQVRALVSDVRPAHPAGWRLSDAV
jgi:hypothetical protein